jgi:hypothetical protein
MNRIPPNHIAAAVVITFVSIIIAIFIIIAWVQVEMPLSSPTRLNE